MHQKPSAYEKFQLIDNQTDVSSISYFQESEEFLELRSGASFYLKPWYIIGMPAFLESPKNNQVSGPKVKGLN
jgi:hypothetical protein